MRNVYKGVESVSMLEVENAVSMVKNEKVAGIYELSERIKNSGVQDNR